MTDFTTLIKICEKPGFCKSARNSDFAKSHLSLLPSFVSRVITAFTSTLFRSRPLSFIALSTLSATKRTQKNSALPEEGYCCSDSRIGFTTALMMLNTLINRAI